MEYWEESIRELEERIGFCFRKHELLRQALTHSSFANEQKINRYLNYERIEFLGDAVLELVSSLYLFETFPDMPEGEMTRQRASMVCESSLAFCARSLSLEKYILLGRGEEQSGGRNRDSILADVLEAVIGAIFLDGGLEPVKRFIQAFVLSEPEDKKLFYDSKSVLQEHVQKAGLGRLTYRLTGETGPEHQKEFYVELYLEQERIGIGAGKNKKSAEQQAAYEALLSIRKGDVCI